MGGLTIKKITFPCLNLSMIPINKILGNNYNPNTVASPEFKLLKKSIREDGYTIPIVVYHDKIADNYIIVDGYHRFKCGQEFKIKEIPATIIDKPMQDRMASTIRHNRARGKHGVEKMVDIVLDLSIKGWSDSKIAVELGMEPEELIRLKQQAGGIAKAHANSIYSNSWE